MCRHIPNAQATIRAACCKRWFDCTQCHDEANKGDHELFKTMELIVACKACRKVFKKDLSIQLEQADEYCPYCDNHFVIEVVEQGEEEGAGAGAGAGVRHNQPGGMVTGADEAVMIRSDNRFLNDPRMKPPAEITEEEMIALMAED